MWQEATSNKDATRNRCISISNKKLLVVLAFSNPKHHNTERHGQTRSPPDLEVSHLCAGSRGIHGR